jgi:[ribosomal protein S18]-alanine N-acetyltransferase
MPKPESQYMPVLRISFVPMTEEHAKAICDWKYEPPYDLYHWKPWHELERNNEEIANPAIREEQYASALSHDGTLIGFVQFFPLSGWTRLGLGLHPEARGRGWGEAFVRAIVNEALQRDPNRTIDLEVLVWNERARRVYEKAGFQVTDQYERMTPSGIGDFYCMEYNEQYSP